MASSFSLTSSSTYEGRTMTLSCTQTKDITNNRSLISWSLSVSGGSSHYYATGPTNVYINGTHVWAKDRVGAENEFPASDKVSGVSGSLYVNHDSDGSKSISISLSTAIYYGSTSVKTDSTTWYLDSIARASTPTMSSTDFYIPNTTTVYSNRVSTSFWHYLYFLYPNGVYGNPITSFTDSFVFDPINTVNVQNYCQTSWYFSGQFLLRTYYGSTAIGDKTIIFTVRIPDYTIDDPSSVSVGTIPTYNGNILNGISTIPISFVPASFNYGAYFSHLYVTLVNITDMSTGAHTDICRIYDAAPPTPSSGVYSINPKIQGVDFGSETTKNCGIKISIQDSRGKIKDYLVRDNNSYCIITIKKYINPIAQGLSLYRCDANGDESKNGTYLDIKYDNLVVTSGYTGRVSYCYRINSSGDDYDADVTPTFEYDNTSSCYKLSSKIPNIENNRSYDFIIKVSDGYGTNQYVSQTTYGFTIPLGKTDFNMVPTRVENGAEVLGGLGIGQYFNIAHPGTIQTPYDLIIKGKNIIDIIYPIGAIYLSINSTSPETLFGGTWERITDRFLLASGNTYQAGSMGGSATNTHEHYQTVSNDERTFYATDVITAGVRSRVISQKRGTINLSTTGQVDLTREDSTYKETINIMPPYLVVYMWKRTG